MSAFAFSKRERLNLLGGITGVGEDALAQEVGAEGEGLDIVARGNPEGDGDVVRLGGVVLDEGGGELVAGDDGLGDVEADDAGRGEGAERQDAGEDGVLEKHGGGG